MLTDATCRKAKPNPGAKERKLSDAKGLHLAVSPTGYKVWRFQYRFAEKQKKLVIGPYPEISLAEARIARDKAAALLRDGIDPSVARKQRKAAALAEALDTFELIARAWHKQRSPTLNARYAEQILSRFEENVFAAIGSLPIKQITPPLVLSVLRTIEERGAHEMAHRVRGHMSDVFVWAISSGLADQDPAAVVRKALARVDKSHRPALTKLDAAREFLTKTEAQPDIYWATRLASRLLALTAARPGVVRLAEKKEFESLGGTSPIWRIPAEKMKLTRERKKDITLEFIIPLPPEAVAVIQAAMRASDSPKWLFPGISGHRQPISDSTLSKHYREAGFTGQHVPHGWRSTFSTIMNQLAAQANNVSDRAIIDLMLAHMPDGVEPIYNRHLYMERRRELALAWAEMLMEGLPPPESLLPNTP
jgi:integrase